MNRSIISLGLLTSALAWSAAASPAPATNARPAPPDLPDKAAENPVDFAADQITYDTENEVVVAIGNVELTQNNNRVLADSITYNQKTGLVTAEGRIRFIDKSGNILFVDKLELADDLKNGFITNIRALLSDDARIAALDGRREDGVKTTFNHALYSPCNVCAEKPEKAPLWQIKAVRVVHDADKKRIRYKNAYLELWGVPILYTPYLSHAEPGVEKASGLLAPKFGHSSQLGYTFGLPYYLALAPDKDLTLEPLFTTSEGVVLFSEYRQHVGFGKFKATGSTTYTDKRDDQGVKTGQKIVRGHVFSNGKFQLDNLDRLGGKWQWRYDAQWASDDTYLRKYDISTANTLTSDLLLERFEGRSYGIMSAYHFQGLRAEDSAGLTPIVLPMLDYHYVGKPGIYGSKILIDADAMAITRTKGMDTRRFSLNSAWELPYNDSAGNTFNLTASLRSDAYNVTNAEHPDDAAYAGQNGWTSRLLPQLTLKWSHPLVSYAGSLQQVIEPLITLIAAPKGGNPSGIPNEDSRAFELDEFNLFSSNRFTGLDRFDGGSRVAYGLRYGIYGPKTQARVVVGQTYEVQEDDAFARIMGMSGHWSNYVIGLTVNVSPYVDYIHKIQLDKGTFALRRNEADVIVGPRKFKVTVGYLDIKKNVANTTPDSLYLLDRREISTAVRYLINDNWTTYGSYTRNLRENQSIYSRAGLIYENECVQFEVSYNRRYTRDRDIVPSTSINLRIVLKHLN